MRASRHAGQANLNVDPGRGARASPVQIAHLRRCALCGTSLVYARSPAATGGWPWARARDPIARLASRRNSSLRGPRRLGEHTLISVSFLYDLRPRQGPNSPAERELRERSPLTVLPLLVSWTRRDMGAMGELRPQGTILARVTRLDPETLYSSERESSLIHLCMLTALDTPTCPAFWHPQSAPLRCLQGLNACVAFRAETELYWHADVARSIAKLHTAPVGITVPKIRLEARET